MHFLTLPFKQSLILNKLELLSPEEKYEINCHISSKQCDLTLRLNNLIKDTIIDLDLKLFRVLIEGDQQGSFLTCSMQELPKVKSSGDFLLDIGSKLINLATSFISFQDLKPLLEYKIPGFMLIDKDIVLPLPDKEVPNILKFLLQKGLSIEVIPWKTNWFLVKFYFNVKDNH